MKQNSKFLLMLSLLIGMVGLLMVGCDDTTVEQNPPIPDKVVGSIEGIVLDANTHAPIGDLFVIYWDSTGMRDTVMTENDGSFLIPEPLHSGNYTIHIVDPEEGYTMGYNIAYIPTLDQLKGDIDVNPSGEVHYRASFFDDCETENCLGAIVLFNKCASVRGQLWSAIPDGYDGYEWETAPKNEDGELALEADTSISPIGGVVVLLTYPKDCGVVPLVWTAETDAEGFYTFTGLPEYDGELALTIPPFAYGDSSYQQFDTSIYLVHCEPITVPDVYGIVDCRSVPTVLSYNFKGSLPFNYYDNLVMEFSEPMDTATFRFTLENYEGEVSVNYSWNQASEGGSGDSILTIDPYLVLYTDVQYVLIIDSAFSKSGCPLNSRFNYLPFRTEKGIELFATNAETAPGVFSDFQIEDNITLTFTMPPVLDPIYGTLTLTDVTTGVSFPVAFDSSVAGNVLTINPNDNLELSHKYQVCYGVFSSIPGDYDEYCFYFWTEIDPNPPGLVPNFAQNERFGWRCDWNTDTLHFRWDAIPAAAGFGYKIYAYDNNPARPNTDWIQIADVSSQDYLQFQEATVAIPVQFDRYIDDGIQTPFSDGTHMWFSIRAYNAAGLGPLSTNTIEIFDTTPPGGEVDDYGDANGGNDSLDLYISYGSADNTTGAIMDTVWISLSHQCEYFRRTNNPVWNFVEAGGKENYVLPEANGFWNWNNASRMNDYDAAQATGAYFTIPAGQCAAGDSLYLTFYDNSGNDTTIGIRIRPYIVYAYPMEDSSYEADEMYVEWNVYVPSGYTFGYLDYFLTLDGGATFIDTIEDFGYNSDENDADLSSQWMSDGNARVALRDDDGGVLWFSPFFTINGIMLTSPDSATYYTMAPIYDAEGTDSTAIPMTWDYVGIDTVIIMYQEEVTKAAGWTNFDTVVNTGSYDFYAPDFGYDYGCRVAVSDVDGDYLPIDSTTWYFNVINDYITFVDPSAAEDVEGGADYDITWELVGAITKQIIIEVSLDGDVDSLYAPIATTANDSLYTWAVPATTPSTNAYMRFRDINDSNTLDVVGPFNITGLTVTAPVADAEWLVGASLPITWDCADPVAVGNVRIWWSDDGFTTDSTEISGGETANDGSYNWTVDAPPSVTTQIRIWGVDQDVYATSDVFTVCGVTVLAPNGGETWAVGSSVNITWLPSCASIDSVEIAYSVNSGSNWTVIIASTLNDGAYTWAVVDNVTADGTAMVRIRDNTTGLGSDASDATFDIAGIVITAPAAGANWANGSTHNIVWTEVSTISNNLEIHYSLDGSAGTFFPVPGASDVDITGPNTFAWTLNAQTDANLATAATCWIRIRETGTGTIWDLNPGAFTISNTAPVTDAGVDQTAAGVDISWDASVSDADAGVLPSISWAWNGPVPAGAFSAVNNGDGTMTFTYTYNATDDGNTYTLDVTGDDGLATHTDSVDLIVTAAP